MSDCVPIPSVILHYGIKKAGKSNLLPTFPDTDFLLHEPNIDGLNLWNADSLEQVPSELGVYCFYDGETKEILYIGSACSRGIRGVCCGGLRKRFRMWRSDNYTSCGKKLQTERPKRKILARCWLTKNASDALKYENDAIEKYKPVLNDRMAKRLDQKTYAMAKKKKKQEYYLKCRQRLPEEFPPDTTIKQCSCCGEKKPLLDFRKRRDKKDGRRADCKKCEKLKYGRQSS
jgi:excinuclease UvrABC nuclease subunit